MRWVAGIHVRGTGRRWSWTRILAVEGTQPLKQEALQRKSSQILGSFPAMFLKLHMLASSFTSSSHGFTYVLLILKFTEDLHT